jgi:hypothetical protein
MRWATRQHVLTSKARRRSLWHHWFAWYPVVVKVDDELDHWVWFERLERKWSLANMAVKAIGGIGNTRMTRMARPRGKIKEPISGLACHLMTHGRPLVRFTARQREDDERQG